MSKKSFTLVEMGIVVVTIGLLGTTLIPIGLNNRERTIDVANKTSLQQVNSALILYGNDKGRYPGLQNIRSINQASNIDTLLIPNYLTPNGLGQSGGPLKTAPFAIGTYAIPGWIVGGNGYIPNGSYGYIPLYDSQGNRRNAFALITPMLQSASSNWIIYPQGNNDQFSQGTFNIMEFPWSSYQGVRMQLSIDGTSLFWSARPAERLTAGFLENILCSKIIVNQVTTPYNILQASGNVITCYKSTNTNYKNMLQNMLPNTSIVENDNFMRYIVVTDGL